MTFRSPSNVPAFLFRDAVREYLSREGSLIRALDSLSFEAPERGITCLVGPTGCGKSTALRISSGIETPDSGTVLVAGSLPAEMLGRIGYLTQRHTLFPWMRVSENIALPMEIKGIPPEDRRRRTGQILEMLGLTGTDRLYPYELSGGMQQRAAIGRLLSSGADFWLMDEPFTALDEKTLHSLQNLLLRIVRENSITTLFVTHSIDEAVFLADRVVILSAGPGRLLDSFEVDLAHPRDRLSPRYGELIEKIRRKIESVLSDEPQTQFSL